MRTVWCRGCGRSVAVTPGEAHTLYCTEACAKDYPVSSHEDRDSLVETLSQLGWEGKDIAPVVGASRQRIWQIRETRKVG